jgi:hypothetical protein
MSFAMTTEAYRNREKCQGIPKGEHVVRMRRGYGY